VQDLTPTDADVAVFHRIGRGTARCSVHRAVMDDGVGLLVARWIPTAPTQEPALVFVAGWVSVVEGWAPLLEELVGRRQVVYVETREKRSAVFPERRLSARDFTLDRLAEDLVTVCSELPFAVEHAVLFASSMGSNTILEACKGDRLRARGAFLVGPNAAFRFRWWGRLVVRLPTWLYPLLRGFIAWYLRRFRVREPEQMERYERTLAAAHPLRLKLSAQALIGYSAWPDLETATTPMVIAHAPTDTLHGEEDAQAIATRLPDARAVQCPSNHYMHSPAVAAELEAFERELSARR
jgi:hypothetical protein